MYPVYKKCCTSGVKDAIIVRNRLMKLAKSDKDLTNCSGLCRDVESNFLFHFMNSGNG